MYRPIFILCRMIKQLMVDLQRFSIVKFFCYFQFVKIVALIKTHKEGGSSKNHVHPKNYTEEYRLITWILNQSQIQTTLFYDEFIMTYQDHMIFFYPISYVKKKLECGL